MFETLSTLFRARSAEAEEALIERNAAALLAQHLRDAKVEIARSRAAVARLMAREAERGRALDALAKTILGREGEAKAALGAGDENLAADIADAIIALEDRKATEVAAQEALSARIAEARERLEETERRYGELAEQLRQAREAGLSRTIANAAAPSRPPVNGALDRAVETAATLKARDDRLADLDAAYKRLDGEAKSETLDARIAAAGLNKEKEARRAALLARISPEKPKTGGKS